MELFLIILRNIVIAIAILYALIVIVSVSFALSFASILSHHNHDLVVILTNKRDNLSKLAALYTTSGIKLDKKTIDSLNNFNLKRIETQDGEDAKKAREELTSYYEYLMSIDISGKKLADEEEYVKILENINELESVYRHHLMMYNADVLGYNFWIKFFPTRYIFLILRFKTHDNI